MRLWGEESIWLPQAVMVMYGCRTLFAVTSLKSSKYIRWLREYRCVVTPVIGGEPGRSPSMCLSISVLNFGDEAVEPRDCAVDAGLKLLVNWPHVWPKGCCRLPRDLVGEGVLLESGGGAVPM